MNLHQSVIREWKTRNRILTIGRQPLVMGIVNVTPDSFSDGGRFDGVSHAVEHALQLVEDGADIIDVGGESTRPGGNRVEAEEEIRRAIPLIEQICRQSDIPVSVDTSKAEVAKAAFDAGAEIINDISGLKFDPEMASAASSLKAGLVLMHLEGKFETMHNTKATDSIVDDVVAGLQSIVNSARSSGIADNRIVLDIGIGFSKTAEQNIELLGRLDAIIQQFSEFPMLVGVSRKSFIGKITGQNDPADRVAGTIAANCIALIKGAAILRVHDVREAADAAKVVGAIWK